MQVGYDLFIQLIGVIEILRSFREVLEWKVGKEISQSSGLEVLEKILGNNFALSDAEENIPVIARVIADMPLLRALLAIR